MKGKLEADEIKNAGLNAEIEAKDIETVAGLLQIQIPIMAFNDAELESLFPKVGLEAPSGDDITIMEQLTRLHVNLDLLRNHQRRFIEDGTGFIDAEVVALRVGDFVLVTFPGELSVELGLRIKADSPHAHTFVSGVTNGYLYYTPTVEQLANRGRAQEDSDCLVDESWEKVFTDHVDQMLKQV